MAEHAEAAFGEAVRRSRREFGWTQEQFRRRLLEGYGIELSKTAMSRLESGDRPVRLNEVHALCLLLGIDLMSLKVDYAQAEVRFVEEQLRAVEADADRWLARLVRLRAGGTS